MPSVSYLLDIAMDADQRRDHERYAVQNKPAILESDLFREEVELINIGARGFAVKSAIHYPQGTTVHLLITPFPPLSAKIAWSGQFQLGARLDDPLDAAQIAAMME